MKIVSANAFEGNKTPMTDPYQGDGQDAAAIKGALLQAKDITIRTHSGVNILSDISFHIEPGELISLTGVSRSGKSTLLRSLAGQIKPASGEILIDGVNLYTNLQAFRSSIGFVPAEAALPQNLKVREILQERALLGLSRRTSYHDRKLRINTLLETVGLTELSDRRVKSLSNAEKRKLSIAVELMSSPAILLLDESSEPLTPFEEVQITILLRTVVRQGHTIIQADHRARNAGLSDKVIFLGPGGVLAWFGPSDEGFNYLKTLVPRGIVKDFFGLKEAIEVLTNPQPEQGVEWAKRYKAQESYEKYVDDPLHNRYPDLMLQTHPLLRLRNSTQEKQPPAIVPRANNFQKLALFIKRDFRLRWRDRTIFFMMAIPLLIALADFLLSSVAGLNPDLSPIIFGLLLFLIMLTSALLVQHEIFKERVIYQRENRASSLSFPYVLSKVWLVGILAIYQGLLLAIIHFIATGMAGGYEILRPYSITFVLIAFIGGLIGLIISALSRTAMTTTNWVLLFTIPQLIFSGAIFPVVTLNFPSQIMSSINPIRYALDALLAASGYGEGLNGSPSRDWLTLLIMGLCLIVLLAAIQRGAGRVRI